MPRYIVHHDGQFLEWSTVTDSPATFAGTRSEFEAYYRRTRGENGMEELPARLNRAMAIGTSALEGITLEELVSGNRAGPGEAELSREDIIRYFFVEKRDPPES